MPPVCDCASIRRRRLVLSLLWSRGRADLPIAFRRKGIAMSESCLCRQPAQLRSVARDGSPLALMRVGPGAERDRMRRKASVLERFDGHVSEPRDCAIERILVDEPATIAKMGH